jgi:hypothetical protein
MWVRFVCCDVECPEFAKVEVDVAKNIPWVAIPAGRRAVQQFPRQRLAPVKHPSSSFKELPEGMAV